MFLIAVLSVTRARRAPHFPPSFLFGIVGGILRTWFCLENKFCPHGNCATGKIANVVVVEIGVSRDAERSGLRPYATYCFRALIEQVEDLRSDLEVESSVGTEPSVL